MRRIARVVFALGLCAVPLGAQGLTNVQVGEKQLTARIDLPGGIGADLEISFESVVGLSATSLGVSAELVDPNDLTLAGRLPNGQLDGVAGGFPVLLRIEPPAEGPLSFSGTVTVALHTQNLAYTTNSPLRLFSAPLDGTFHDVTTETGMGSYRVRGTKGGFSELLIVSDLRPVDQVIEGKFDALQDRLDEGAEAIPTAVADELQASLGAAWTAYQSGDLVTASQDLDAFTATVVAHSGGSGIPDTWRSARDLDNLAGGLRSDAATLRYSLSVKANGGV